MTITSAEEWEGSHLRRSQQENPDLEPATHGLDMNRWPRKEQKSAGSPFAKAQLRCLRSGYLHRIWENKDGQCLRNLIVVSKLRIPFVLKEFNNGPSGRLPEIAKILEKIKQRYCWVGCRQSVAEWIANYRV